MGWPIGFEFFGSNAVVISVALAISIMIFAMVLNTVSFMVRHGNSKNKLIWFGW